MADLEVERDNALITRKTWEFVFEHTSDIPMLKSPRVPTDFDSLDFEVIDYTKNLPPGLDDSTVSRWCRKIKADIKSFYDRKYNEDTLRRVDYYVSKAKRSQKEVYTLQKSVFSLEKENKALRAMGRAYNRALKFQMLPSDNSDKVMEKRQKINKLLCIALRHTIVPPLPEEREE